MVNAELVAKWRGWTRFPLDMVMVPGGHFHPLERPAQLVELIRGRISG